MNDKSNRRNFCNYFFSIVDLISQRQVKFHFEGKFGFDFPRALGDFFLGHPFIIIVYSLAIPLIPQRPPLFTFD